MPRILLIDDDPQLCTLVSRILTKNGYVVDNAKDGANGLKQAKDAHPDLIILDIIMPGMDGFEVARRLHGDPACAHIPIMALTALATPYAQKTAIDAGVSAFVTKPFGVEEIMAKVGAILHADVSPIAQTSPLEIFPQANLISVHSLRGGLGCTTLAVNLALALKAMWHLPTLLLDGDFANGQVAMNLKWRRGLSWSDLLRATARDSIGRALQDSTIVFDSELHLLSAPRDLADADQFTARIVDHSLRHLVGRYEYIVADLAHDVRDCTFEFLNKSEKILHLLAPDSISLELADRSLNAYATLGIKPDMVEFVLVDTRPGNPVNVRAIEQLLGRPLAAYIPYAAELNDAVERGQPFISAHPSHPISRLTEDLAYLLSKQTHRDNNVHTAPTATNSKPRSQLSPAGQNGTHHGIGRSLLRQFGLIK